MSQLLHAVEPVKIRTPLTDVNKTLVYGVLEGGRQITFKQETTTNISSSGFSIKLDPPNDVIMDRLVKIEIDVTLNFTCTNSGANNMLQSGYDAFRSLPIEKITQNQKVFINGFVVQRQLYDNIDAFMWFNDNDRNNIQEQFSSTPAALDRSQSYAQLLNTNLNPLNSWSDATVHRSGRGAFSYLTFTNTTTSASVRAVLTSYLMVNPLMYGNQNKEDYGMYGVRSFQVDYTFAQDLSFMWSHAANPDITNFAVTPSFNSATLRYKTVTPGISFIPEPIYQYPYKYYNIKTTDYGSQVAPGGTGSMSSDTIQLSTIPAYFLIFLKKRVADRAFTDTDSYFGITQVTAKWANTPNQMSEMSQRDLYQMCVKNGYQGSFQDWTGDACYEFNGTATSTWNGTGSLLKIRMCEDIALIDANQAPGVGEKNNVQFEIQFKNNHPSESIRPTMYVIAVEDQVFSIDREMAYSQANIISYSDVINSAERDGLDFHSLMHTDMQGGVNLKKVGRWFKRAGRTAYHGLKGVAKVAPDILQAVDTIKAVAGAAGGQLVGGRKRRSSKKGGQLMDRSQLRKRLESAM